MKDTMEHNPTPIVSLVFGIAWISVVLSSYYYYNAAYFTYKIGVFGGFILKALS